MAYQSEIEKLERRYQENPDQWFAALADQYRKSGSLEMALEVVRNGIAKRPNYVSGHIVLGRCLLDQKNDLEASNAFRRVLELDGENIMALKFLGEISQRAGDPEDARRWLGRLLDVDPMNDEAREAMDRLGPPPQASASAPTPVASLSLDDAPGDTPAGFETTSLAFEEPPAVAPEPETALAPEAPADALPIEGGWETASEAPFSDEPAAAEPEAVETPTPRWTSSLSPAPSTGYEKTVEVAPIRLPPTTPEPPAPVDPVSAIFADEPVVEDEPIVQQDDVWPPEETAAAPTESPWPVGDEPESTVSEAVWSAPAEAAPPVEGEWPEVEPAEATPVEASADDSWPPAEQSPPLIETYWSPAEPPRGTGDSWAPPSGDVTPDDEPSPASEPTPEPEPAMPPEPAPVASSRGPAPPPPPLELMPFDDRLAWGTGERTSREIKAEDLAAAARLFDASIDHDTARFVVGDLAQAGGTGAGQPPAAADAPGGSVRSADTTPETPEPEPVVTETMAELYANQGLIAEARGVYEQLVQARPGDTRLEARLAELRAVGSGPLPRRGARLAASVTGGVPVRGFLAEILRARAGGAPHAVLTAVEAAHASPPQARKTPPAVQSPMEAAFEREPAGAPTVPATDDVSLAAVFGEEPPPPPPAPPAPPASAARAGGFSFDEFFGSRPPDPQRPKARASQQDTDPTGEDDFKAWLKGLKT